jgi:hypothetical protein
MQFRPYSWEGPINVKETHPAISKRLTSLLETLGELEQFAHLATQSDKLVLLVVGLCPVEGCPDGSGDKAWALAPLLDRRHLALWNYLVVDQETAQVINERFGGPEEGDPYRCCQQEARDEIRRLEPSGQHTIASRRIRR